MWNEPSAGIAVSALESGSVARQPQPAVVDQVEPGSIGEELGFEPGDQLLSINGVRPRDLIDYRYLCVDEELHLEVRDASGALHQVDLEKPSLVVATVLRDPKVDLERIGQFPRAPPRAPRPREPQASAGTRQSGRRHRHRARARGWAPG